MPDARDQTTDLLSRLEVPLSREYISFTGNIVAVAAAVLFIIAIMGWYFFSRLMGALVNGYILEWLIFFFIFTVFFGIGAHEYLHWAKHGPDLWLRITPAGLELVQAVFRIRQHRLAWPEIGKWSMLIYSSGRRTFKLKTTSGRDLVIYPMEYVWTRKESERNQASSVALGRDIEALFKQYAKDRQGETEKMSGG